MKRKSFFLVILAGILWGTSGIFVHYLAPLGYTSMQMTAMRASVGAVAMAAYALAHDRGLFKIRKLELCIFALTAIGLFGTGTFYFTSMQASSISTAVVLMYMAPVYVTVFSVLFFGERLNAAKVISVVLMLAGCALVSGIITDGLTINMPGIAAGVLAGISYGAYNILTKLSMRIGISPEKATCWVFMLTAVIAIVMCEPSDLLRRTAEQPAASIPLIIGIGAVTFILPYLCYTVAMKHLDACTTSALGIVEPMSATMFGCFILGETLDIWTGTGVALILSAVLLLSRGENKAKKP